MALQAPSSLPQNASLEKVKEVAHREKKLKALENDEKLKDLYAQVVSTGLIEDAEFWENRNVTLVAVTCINDPGAVEANRGDFETRIDIRVGK